MPQYTSNLDLYKVDLETDGNSTFNIKTMLNDNWDKIDSKYDEQEGRIRGNSEVVNEVSEGMADIAYKQATVNGREIQLTVPSFTFTNNKYISVEIIADVPEGNALTVKVNSDTAISFKDVDNNPLTRLDKGFYTFIARTGTPNFFLLAPKGADIQSIYGAYDGTNEITVAEKVKQGQYVYSNKDLELNFDTVTPIEIDYTTPITVTNTSFSTNREAKPQILDNGWVVVTIWESNYIRFYVNKNNGLGFKECAYRGNATGTPIYSVASKGTIIYFVFTTLTYSGLIGGQFDLLDFDNNNSINLNSSSYTTQTISTFNTAGYGCFLTITDDKQKIGVCWCAKTSSYPNSYNIFYRKGQIGLDGNITWGSEEQLTNTNVSVTNFTEPHLIYDNSNSPIIFNRTSTSSAYLIAMWKKQGDSWSSQNIYTASNIEIQGEPQAIRQKYGDNINRIWCIWRGYPSSSNTYWNALIKYSDDNGDTWNDGGTVGINLLPSSLYHKIDISITENSSGNIYVVYRGKDDLHGSVYNIKTVKRVGNNWGNEVNITNVSTGINHMMNPSICENNRNFELPLIAWEDNINNRVAFYGKFNISSNKFIIPSIENGTNGQGDTQFKAPSTGTLKSYGTDPQQITGFISKKPIGWSKVDIIPKVKMVSGTTTSSSSFSSFTESDNSTHSAYYITIDTTTLGFVPQKIIVEFSTDTKYTTTLWSYINIYKVNASNYGNCTITPRSPNRVYRVPYIVGHMRIPVNSASTIMNWKAYGGE